MQRKTGRGRPETILMDFESGDLAPERFDHDAHVAVAWALLREAPFHLAVARFVKALKAFAATHGADGLYHETITLFFFHEIARRMESGEEWPAFRMGNEELFSGGRDLLARHYSAEVLASPAARHHFLPPRAWWRVESPLPG